MSTIPRLAVIVLTLTASAGLRSLAVTSTSVENLTPISSTTIRNGLGFNIGNIKDEWEFKMAADAGATEVRFQPGWSSVQNMAGVFAMPAVEEKALNFCSTYKLMPLLVAGYSSPYQGIGNFTVAQDYPIGSTTVRLNQSVSAVVFPYCHVMGAKGLQLVPVSKWGYYGALIASADPATNSITLAAATNVALKADQPLIINRLLYPSCLTSSPDDPSIIAYAAYAAYMADRIAAHGLTGRIELWNEPAWAHDPWDHRGAFYDHAPPEITAASPNFGIAENIAKARPPTGVRYNWGGTNKSGARSVLNNRLMNPPLTAAQVADSISCEAYHPYGNCPEDDMWDPVALAVATTPSMVNKAALPGASWGANFKNGHWMSLQNPSLNFRQNITETGHFTADNVRKARFAMRQYLGYLGLGLERITFFQLGAPNATSAITLGFADSTTRTPDQAYTAIQGLVVTDMAKIPAAPAPYATADLPAVSSYQGTYPLMAVAIVGRHAETDARNTFYFATWQRSLVPPGPATDLAVTSTKNQISLTWKASFFAVDNTLERATTSGGPYEPVAAHLTTSTFTDKSAVAGTPYYYVLVGNSPGGVSSNSNEVSATMAATGNGTFNNSSRPGGPDQPDWLNLPAPAPGRVTTTLPANCHATAAWNLVTRAAVPLTPSAGAVTYPVADDPVCLAVVPVSGTAQSNPGGPAK